ncbi:MAG: hypothetical protein GY835_22570 [bacterium]|nr:hypothetical protein [bacterium]
MARQRPPQQGQSGQQSQGQQAVVLGEDRPYWKLGGILGASIVPWTWKQTRGVYPYIATILCPDNRFGGLGIPKQQQQGGGSSGGQGVSLQGAAPQVRQVGGTAGRALTLEIHAPEKRMDRETVIKFERLFLISEEQVDTDLWAYQLADIRWLLGFGVMSANFNIVSYGGLYRPDSFQGDGTQFDIPDFLKDYKADNDTDGAWESSGSARYTVRGAVLEGIARVGESLGPEDRSQLPSPLVHQFNDDARLKANLQPNLGNSPGGGFAAAKMAEFVPVMLRDAGDITVARDGRVWIVDRSSKYLTQWEHHIHVMGGLSKKQVAWQKPKRATIHYEMRICAWFEHVGLGESPSGESIAGNQPARLVLENVIPEWTDINDTTSDTVPKWRTLSKWLKEEPIAQFGLNATLIEERMLQPFMIDTSELNADDRAIARRIEKLIRTYWRRCWRIPTDLYRRQYADIRFGKLNEDGTCGKPIVCCDFTTHYRWQQSEDAPMSESFSFRESPFTPVWMDKEEGVLYLKLDESRPSIETVYPGKLKDDIRLPTIDEILDEGELAFECTSEFTDEFSWGLWWNGLFVAAATPAGDALKRTHTMDRPLFGDGLAGTVNAKVRGITANVYVDYNDNLNVLNQDQLDEYTEYAVQQLRQSYIQERAGTLQFKGVDVIDKALAQLKAPCGDMHEIEIHLGSGRKLYEIGASIRVQPEVRQAHITKPESVDPIKLL